MVIIRLKRMGAKKKPFYRIVVTDSRRSTDGRTNDIVGYYDPLKEPPEIKIDLDKVNLWFEKGAQASKTVQSLIKRVEESSN